MPWFPPMLLSSRWAFGDLLGAATFPESAPIPEVPGGPFERLHVSARELGVNVLDLRGLPRNVHYDPKEWGWFKNDIPKKNVPTRARAGRRRKWSKVTGIMLHTTAVDMGPKRFLGVPVHDGIAEDATIILCHPHDIRMPHGNGANSFTAGVEISGHSDCTDLQAEAAKILVRYIYEDVQDHHQHAMVMMGHIQSHRRKVRDPGAEVWRKVALPMMTMLHLEEGPVIGRGHRIPSKWKEGGVPVSVDEVITKPLA